MRRGGNGRFGPPVEAQVFAAWIPNRMITVEEVVTDGELLMWVSP